MGNSVASGTRNEQNERWQSARRQGARTTDPQRGKKYTRDGRNPSDNQLSIVPTETSRSKHTPFLGLFLLSTHALSTILGTKRLGKSCVADVYSFWPYLAELLYWVTYRNDVSASICQSGAALRTSGMSSFHSIHVSIANLPPNFPIQVTPENYLDLRSSTPAPSPYPYRSFMVSEPNFLI